MNYYMFASLYMLASAGTLLMGSLLGSVIAERLDAKDWVFKIMICLACSAGIFYLLGLIFMLMSYEVPYGTNR